MPDLHITLVLRLIALGLVWGSSPPARVGGGIIIVPALGMLFGIRILAKGTSLAVILPAVTGTIRDLKFRLADVRRR